MVNLARRAIVLPTILLANLLFASYFLDLTLNPFSAPQPYRNLLLILVFYACTLSLSLHFSDRSTTLSPEEKNALGASIVWVETLLALVWWFGVLIFTPSDEGVLAGKEVEWWTTARGTTLGLSGAVLLLGMTIAARKCPPIIHTTRPKMIRRDDHASLSVAVENASQPRSSNKEPTAALSLKTGN
jgi:hypothetical protein